MLLHFQFGFTFYMLCYVMLLLNSCFIFWPYTKRLYKWFAEVHTLFYYVMFLRIQKSGKKKKLKKDVIALGHSTFELANHSTFIDLRIHVSTTQAVSQPKGHTWGTFHTTKIYNIFRSFFSSFANTIFTCFNFFSIPKLKHNCVFVYM